MRRIIPLFAFCLVAIASQGQDPQFSQFYANPLYLNPAFAGSAGGPRIALNSRYQWPSASSGDFQTYCVSYDQHFDALGGGIGAQVMYDRAGDGNLATTGINLFYSYQLNLTDELSVKAGIQAGVFQRSLDWDKLRFPDQIHPRLGFVLPTAEQAGEQTIGPIADFSAGAIAYTERYYGGFAVQHISQPNQSFYPGRKDPSSNLRSKITVHAGMMIPLDKGSRNPTTFVSPNILFQKQATYTQVVFGGYYIKNHFVTGLMFRATDPNPDALIALIGVKKDALRIGYSYDVSVSAVKAAARGSHEISLVAELPVKKRVKAVKWKPINCPNI